MTDVVIVSCVRTAVGRGKADGALASVHPVDLSAAVMKAAIERAGIDPARVDDVQWGCAMPEASQGLNHARLAWLRAGLPGGDLGGHDQPLLLVGAAGGRVRGAGDHRRPRRRRDGRRHRDDVAGADVGLHTRLSPEITESYIGMGFTAERVASGGTSRVRQQDDFAFAVAAEGGAALANGVFAPEIVPVTRRSTRGMGRRHAHHHVTDVAFDTDECPRPKPRVRAGETAPGLRGQGHGDRRQRESLLRWRGGGARDASPTRRRNWDCTPLARFVSFATAGCRPTSWAWADHGMPKALARAGLTLSDLKLIEFNEAFAAQALAVIRSSTCPPTSST
jgi:acetyl-CoA acyltransferase